MIALISDTTVFLDYLYLLNFLQYICISLEWKKLFSNYFLQLETNGLNYFGAQK